MVKMGGSGLGDRRLPAIGRGLATCGWLVSATSMVGQCGRGDSHPMRGFQNGVGKRNTGVKPMPRQPNIAVLTINPVDLDPVDKAVTGPVFNIA